MNYSAHLASPTPHSELMQEARTSLSPQWGLAIGTYLVFIVVSIAASFIPFGTFAVGGPLTLGLSIFSLKIARGQEAEVRDLFDGFNHFVNALVAYLLMVIIIGIGMIFLIVPGIIVGLGLALTFFILADNPEMSGVDAMKKSWDMMQGRKGDLFVLYLRFIPWALLCVLTFGIGFLWLGPYMHVTYCNFYDDVRRQMGEINDDESTGNDIIQHLVD